MAQPDTLRVIQAMDIAKELRAETITDALIIQTERLADRDEELAKAMEIVQLAADFNTLDGRHVCVACDYSAIEGNTIQHSNHCPVIWLRRHGLV